MFLQGSSGETGLFLVEQTKARPSESFTVLAKRAPRHPYPVPIVPASSQHPEDGHPETERQTKVSRKKSSQIHMVHRIWILYIHTYVLAVPFLFLFFVGGGGERPPSWGSPKKDAYTPLIFIVNVRIGKMQRLGKKPL